MKLATWASKGLVYFILLAGLTTATSSASVPAVAQEEDGGGADVTNGTSTETDTGALGQEEDAGTADPCGGIYENTFAVAGTWFTQIVQDALARGRSRDDAQRAVSRALFGPNGALSLAEAAAAEECQLVTLSAVSDASLVVAELTTAALRRPEPIAWAALLGADCSPSGLPPVRVAERFACWNVGATRGLVAQIGLSPPVALVFSTPWSPLLGEAADHGVILRIEPLPPVGILAEYRQRTRTIVIDQRVTASSAYSPRVQAAVLAHELRHAMDDARGNLGSGATCLANEEAAFLAEGTIWSSLWDGNLPRPINRLEDQLNEIVTLMDRDPYELIRRYLAAYGHQCTV